MPFNVAVEQPYTRVICLKPYDSITSSVDGNCVASCRHGWPVSRFPIVDPLAGRLSFGHLELMPVEMEGVDGTVEVVHRDLNDVSFLCYERIDSAVD